MDESDPELEEDMRQWLGTKIELAKDLPEVYSETNLSYEETENK